MADFQKNKALVLDYYRELDAASGNDITAVLRRYTSDDWLWRGMHPFYEQHGADAVSEVFWKPFRHSFTSIQRRPDVFMAGQADANVENGIPGSEWVCSMGHLMGLFDEPWLGIPPSGKMGFLRYVEFNRIADGKIVETALFCDIISVMQQVGLNPLPLQTGAAFITPGPRTHDGLLHEVQDPAEGEKTLGLINQMIKDLTSSYMESPEEQLAQTWHNDMIWFGPAGIGATYTRARYREQHQGPFRAHLKDIKYNGHVCRMAEGCYGGFFGWANLSMKTSGNFMGLPASDHPTEMRVVDIYRRDGDKLAENWIFIDMLHFLYLQKLDVLGRMQSILRT
jgi:predicted ester cyclase